MLSTSKSSMKSALLTYLSLLLPTLVSFGCYGGFGGSFSGVLPIAPSDRPLCPDPPLAVWMIPKIEGQPEQLCDRRMSVQGTYAARAEIIMTAQGIYAPIHEIRPHYRGGDCWTTAGLPLATLTEAVSTALAHAGPMQVAARPEVGKYMFQFEVERQSLFFTSNDSGLRSCTATISMSYAVLVSNRKDPIWKEKITGKYTAEKGPRIYGSRSMETAAIEGAVAANLSVLIKKLKDLQFDKE